LGKRDNVGYAGQEPGRLSHSAIEHEMNLSMLTPEFRIERNQERCIACQVCVRQCANDVHVYDGDDDWVYSDEAGCVGCHRCMTLCPTHALTIRRTPRDFRANANWTADRITGVYKQAETGGILLTGMGCDSPYPIYFDHLLINASQVTNPSIDPLREPMELRTYIGRKPDRVEVATGPNGVELKTQIAPQLTLETPIMFSAMSYGSISYNACQSLARAAEKSGILYNTGEGGLHPSLYKYGPYTIAQVASGRFGVHPEYLHAAAALEIKIGQGAKPGIGGHLPGEKVTAEISQTRMIPEGSDALSPAPHHDIYSIEDLRQLIYALKEATDYQKPVGVKVAAVHHIAPIASGIARAGADYIAVDGLRGGTGAAPTIIRNNVGIPIELAISAIDRRLRDEGIRNQISLIAAGSIRNSADVVKIIALGADAVYIGTSALIALGCHLCQKCYTGKCNWGIATQDPYLTKRLNPNIGYLRLSNLIRAWSLEIKEMLGGMGINAIDSLRGNRDHLRGVGLNATELEALGVKIAGSA